jgi:hypothetical protein
MNGLIGLIVFIVILNVIGRIIGGISKAARQQKQTPGQGPGLAELLEKLKEATEERTEAVPEEPAAAADEGPFSWLREDEEQEPLSPAPGPPSAETEFVPYPEVEYTLDDRLVVEPVPVYTGEETFEKVPGMPLETPFERPDITGPARVTEAPHGLHALVDARFAGLRRAIVYSEILRPCLAARKRPSVHRYA